MAGGEEVEVRRLRRGGAWWVAKGGWGQAASRERRGGDKKGDKGHSHRRHASRRMGGTGSAAVACAEGWVCSCGVEKEKQQ